MIVISTFAPRVGDYVLTRGFGLSRIRRVFHSSVGDEMVGFRRDMRLKYVRGIEVSEEAPKKAELLSDIKRTRTEIRRRHTIGEILIGVSGSALALFVGSFTILGGLAILLSVYLLVFPISMFLRSVVVDTLAYSGELVDEDEEEILYLYNWPTATLGFQQGWNRMLLTNEAVIHKIILVSYLKGEFVFGYELGEELIEKVLTGEMELEEAFDELVYDHIGEDAPEAHIFRRVVKRFLGI
ncbi:hypothetical protein [Haloferax sulfurifontis]|nr:hypothetical protein [Haloferax sulfurifontis]